MNSLGKGPEMICSYGEGSCKRAFVMREERSGWSTKGAKGCLDLHAPAAQGLGSHTQTDSASCAETLTGRVGVRVKGTPSSGKEQSFFTGMEKLGILWWDVCASDYSTWFMHNKVREEIWDVFENESFWMRWDVYQIWQRVKFCALFLGNIYIHRCKNGS